MGAIDLYEPQFWWFVLAALLLMVPQTDASARKWTFAGLNLVFLAIHDIRLKNVSSASASTTAENGPA